MPQEKYSGNVLERPFKADLNLVNDVLDLVWASSEFQSLVVDGIKEKACCFVLCNLRHGEGDKKISLELEEEVDKLSIPESAYYAFYKAK